MSGPHFRGIRAVPGSKVDYLGRALTLLHREYSERFGNGSVPEEFTRDWQDHIKFLEYEVGALSNRRTNYLNRSSFAKLPMGEARLILD